MFSIWYYYNMEKVFCLPQPIPAHHPSCLKRCLPDTYISSCHFLALNYLPGFFCAFFLVWISIFLDPLFIFLHVHLTLHSWWIFSEAPVLFFYKNVFGYGHVLSTFILQTLYPISDSNRKKFLHTNIFPNIPSRWFLFHGFFVLFLFWSSHITLKLYTHVLH